MSTTTTTITSVTGVVMMDTEAFQFPANHFLSLPRPDHLDAFRVNTENGAVDTTTLAAHDFDVDNRTGFMPPQPPISRLPPLWTAWEDLLHDAQKQRLRLGETPGLPEDERIKSKKWRNRVRNMPTLTTKELRQSELWLRRAHHILAWIFHFYVHTHPPAKNSEDIIIIPASLTLPLLRVSTQLQLPPVITYADSVLYNWDFVNPPSSADQIPTPSNLRCHTLFTQTLTESEFFLVSARIELIGARALDFMRAMMDEVFVGDNIAARRITGLLWKLQEVVAKVKGEMLQLKDAGCDPDTFYNEVRPWLVGRDSSGRKWVFEGLKEAMERCEKGEDEEEICEPVELSGPSAGQSSLIHSLDIFLGVDKYSHSVAGNNNEREAAELPVSPDALAQKKPSFLARMQQYMPRHHRRFLHHLASQPRPLRDFVLARAEESAGRRKEDRELVDAYNAAVNALKEFRDAHMVIVTLYIIGPAAKVRKGQPERVVNEGQQREGEDKEKEEKEEEEEEEEEEGELLKGTGGTNLVQFLKGVRDQTKNATLPC